MPIAFSPSRKEPDPFALRLSKSLRAVRTGFDKLSPNGASRVGRSTGATRPSLGRRISLLPAGLLGQAFGQAPSP